MMNHWVDSHCHLDLMPSLNQLTHQDQAIYLKQLHQQGCKHILNPSITGKPKPETLALLSIETALTIDVSFGIHPWYIEDSCSETQLESTFNETERQLLASYGKSYIAIGETGLDLLKTQSIDLESQLMLFEKHIVLAQSKKLPLIIHSVRTHELCIKTLNKHGGHQGVIHGFNGSYEQAKQFIDIGFHIGVGGTITYPRAKKTRAAIQRLPLDCLQLETDSPAMPLANEFNQDNHPGNIVSIGQTLADLKGLPLETILDQTYCNYLKLFH